ncbi:MULTISPECIES: helix-turn-helix domain-containing protein [Sphingobacterium]|uniref:Predicted transcriptional regulator n=1 Tax=Sphingobacterium multivorum TaxID=28454 RepID=A0A2X2JK10_SPHMU|nr:MULTISPECIES: helix-turn-helix transcriptional regulator [Sphingobacterium]QRQ60037.1 helix-turn-helix transcriptional regulator [Sphingobacterium multivorum]SPZ92093.1 Predicted transcriptional regulator [Sphingobacterium multivorum]HBI87026.1 transcriptional regulator [Sphingobacterium sp.]
MYNIAKKHIGQNIRKIRLLRGMKQETFAKELGIAQQNVSKMENKKEISEEQLKKVSEVLQASVEAIKGFDENAIINNNILNDQVNNYNIHPVEEIVNVFKGILSSKDDEIAKLRAELLNLKSSSNEDSENSNVRSIKEA